MHLGRVAGVVRRDETTVDEIVKLIVYGPPSDPAESAADGDTE
jgi:hypothetical protein